MSSFTPINARQVEEKKRARARQCYWCVVMKPLEELCTHRDNPDEQCCCDDYEIKRSKEEESAVQAETEDTVGAEHEAPAQATAERPIVKERARGKANNKKTCSRCNGKKYNMSNFADHIKVHALEENGEMQLQWAQDEAA
ncbi:uncharacterized protein FSUBG_2454 [Fusarium subglutinans]|uniref:Uncharacterized protein n=1 Tax=Gibberella subglutinans TaxID=42677 RepID=A0A8H5Q959_GIBSU|nr:uncharacterized protein FSUBG_2454 [Fusarium subglutinans]KAF5611175.1 hypothetical protein FSUBG_2454 [Fusarium subglutinans]